ncbi:exopolysaccharide biosynthesis polyprenyl glycosylphosphotransferase [Paenibacillus sp. UNCCL117]|uniref:sugar transferase n=1 Tax=unclassified Paenibacillus TaxID=185978 RepID=UPI00088EEFB6|nr:MULTISPECIES: sugar transferase [unclassified Paenibacillus]SDC02641.1 exopolysaccharide biosynthesis polyprenyl glycosylphosphotransferase [Paenibacillus sp. cl123]SFW36889.1 exopolysaccharide biosynthesis polyprenyl glycosylphosphotransferase [Paenibacillus sp. UNCCL117]
MSDTNNAEALGSRPNYKESSIGVEAGSRKAYLWAKRAMDIIGAFAGLLLLLPVFAVISVMIKLEDPKGTVFFRQMRVGKNGKPFAMYKFRSMVWNAEALLQELLDKNEIQGAMFKMKDDPRITKVGKLLRVTSLDELPQLWNVLKGEMSLVGPRPPLQREVDQYTRYDKQRLLVVPGCTGLWQVSGRNGLSFEQMVELDLYYIRHQSLWMDIKLIVRTVWIMFFPKNAY